MLSTSVYIYSISRQESAYCLNVLYFHIAGWFLLSKAVAAARCISFLIEALQLFQGSIPPWVHLVLLFAPSCSCVWLSLPFAAVLVLKQVYPPAYG